MPRIVLISLILLLLALPAVAQSPLLLLTITEPDLGEWTFDWAGSATVQVPAGTVMNFSWSARVELDAGIVQGYRYGWDLVDPNDPFDPGWAYEGLADVQASPPMSFQQGTHSLTVRSEDDQGRWSLGTIVVEIEQDVSGDPSSVGQMKGRHAAAR